MSWSLNITAVPEPVNAALLVVAGMFLAVWLGRIAKASLRRSVR